MTAMKRQPVVTVNPDVLRVCGFMRETIPYDRRVQIAQWLGQHR
ncbi:hypothetical protein LV564_04200 [Komagataeibacter nataicola]|nr:hypothetical protein [Komagataeibacter nataicola]WEQ56307.1 hypothetical protein LV564_04200 [Komagataeibacter nataicola]WNM07880.1 hypothetical protein RI056_12805 [Komagataeibacter nataicola]